MKGPSFPEPQPEAEEKKRPLHQRLFGHKEQPAIVPMPPDLERKAELQDEPVMFDFSEDDDSAADSLDAQEVDDREER